jgi:hypothetical protein
VTKLNASNTQQFIERSPESHWNSRAGGLGGVEILGVIPAAAFRPFFYVAKFVGERVLVAWRAQQSRLVFFGFL